MAAPSRAHLHAIKNKKKGLYEDKEVFFFYKCNCILKVKLNKVLRHTPRSTKVYDPDLNDLSQQKNKVKVKEILKV
jgi:hypothetical protein